EHTPKAQRYALVGISDRMLTSGDVEFEQRHHTKIFGLSPARAVCLGAGNVNTAFSISTSTHKQVIASSISEIEQIAQLYADNFSLLKQKRSERLYLSPLGLTIKSFARRQQELSSNLVSELARKIQREELGVTAIICGTDETGPHVYSVGGFDEYG